MNLRLVALLSTLLGVVSLPTAVADTAGYVEKNCAGCHALTKEQSTTLEQRIVQAGPPLYFAGNKFQQGWLLQWLQTPVRIRPAGYYPPAHATTTAEGDVIDAATLEAHPALTADDAESVAEYLMTLQPNASLIAAEADYMPGTVSARMGTMDFVKFKGCGGCHQDTPEYGGVSGPELYTAWNRLQPEFIVSYIRDPLAWQPNSLMPNKHLQSPQLYKLADYLRVIAKPTGEVN